MTTENKQFNLEEWSQSQPASFDAEAHLETRIKPLIDALMTECQAIGLPALVTVAYSQDCTCAGYDVRSHFPSLSRTPAGLLYSLYAAKGDFEAMDAVLLANQLRVMMTAITKH